MKRVLAIVAVSMFGVWASAATGRGGVAGATVRVPGAGHSLTNVKLSGNLLTWSNNGTHTKRRCADAADRCNARIRSRQRA